MSLLTVAALLLFFVAVILLVALALIDLRTMLLPNKYVAPFALAGIGFHSLTSFSFLGPLHMALGCITGYGLLWLVRAYGNWRYKTESMGLGDLKLMGAAGLWLGPFYVVVALTIGAATSIFHGLIVATLHWRKSGHFSFRQLKIPAGPGFITGILIILFVILLPELLR